LLCAFVPLQGLNTFSSFFDALYFSITTLTTVGYGDIVPQSAGGKAFVSVAILLYTVLIPYELGLLANSLGLMNKRQERMDAPGKSSDPPLGTLPVGKCNACGASEHQVDAVFCRKCGKALQ
jgi:voltage-gated potassium channel